MEGFFTKAQTQSTSRPDGKKVSCVACGMMKDIHSPKMPPFGKFKKGIMCIGEFPDETDDVRGKPFQSRAGYFLKYTLEEFGIDLFEDCINLNAVNCKPASTGHSPIKIQPFVLECCRRSVLSFIKQYQPKIIILFGMEAVKSVIGSRYKSGIGKSIDKWRGFTIPDQDLKTWICPVFSTTYVENANSSKTPKPEIINVWKQDLKKAIDLLDNEEFPIFKEPKIHYIDQTRLDMLENIQSQFVAFDYETTGLKPHSEGHKIVCASVAVSENEVYTFMMPTKRSLQQPFIDLLVNKNVGKIAHNMKFEHTWTRNTLHGTIVNPWAHDTMLGAHVLDNRTGITGLKFQTYVNFGVVDYSSEITPILEASNSNATNKLQKYVKTKENALKTLKYCALDSVFTLKLYNLQMKQLEQSKTLVEAYKFLHKGILALAEVEHQGMRVDVEYILNKNVWIDKRIKKLESLIYESEFFEKWKKYKRGPVNIYSPVQMADYLYNCLGIKIKKQTKSGGGSTDEETLALLGIPELETFVDIKKLKKTKTTYLGGFLTEQVDGVIHPIYNLHLTKTYRSSCDSPNLQNVPIRDEETMLLCRKALFPRKDHQLLELDYSQLEVRIAACYHKDPTMLDYLENDHDMHKDIAIQVFNIEEYDSHVHSTLRKAAKNGFVFPQFYGDYYKNNAKTIAVEWCKLPETKWRNGQGISVGDRKVSDVFIDGGITSYDKLISHLKEIEDDFWGNRFPVYDKWKETLWKQYQKNGYFVSKTGFLYQGVMSRNDVTNYPVQGSAFHVMLWSLIKASETFRKYKMKTRIIGQIHDSIIPDVFPKERENVIEIMKQIMEKDVKKAMPWIIVPLKVDVSTCAVNESWATKEED